MRGGKHYACRHPCLSTYQSLSGHFEVIYQSVMPWKFFRCGKRFESVALSYSKWFSMKVYNSVWVFRPEQKRLYGFSRNNCIRTCFSFSGRILKSRISHEEFRFKLRKIKEKKCRNLKVVIPLSQTLYYRIIVLLLHVTCTRTYTTLFYFEGFLSNI